MWRKLWGNFCLLLLPPDMCVSEDLLHRLHRVLCEHLPILGLHHGWDRRSCPGCTFWREFSDRLQVRQCSVSIILCYFKLLQESLLTVDFNNRFDNKISTVGYVDADSRGHCISPLLYETGWVPLHISSDNGTTFNRAGSWFSGNMTELKHKERGVTDVQKVLKSIVLRVLLQFIQASWTLSLKLFWSTQRGGSTTARPMSGVHFRWPGIPL